MSAGLELAWPDLGPSYEWYRELQLAEAEEPPAIMPAPVLTILAVQRPVRCRRCRYLKTWCAGCVGDPDEPTNREIEPEPDGWHDGPDPEHDDPGAEADDQGGVSEYRCVLPEDYGRGQS